MWPYIPAFAASHRDELQPAVRDLYRDVVELTAEDCAARFCTGLGIGADAEDLHRGREHSPVGTWTNKNCSRMSRF